MSSGGEYLTLDDMQRQESEQKRLLAMPEPPADMAGHLAWCVVHYPNHPRFREVSGLWPKFPRWPRLATPEDRKAAMKPALATAAEAWDGSGLLLLGPTGAGKTTAVVHAAECLIRRSIEQKKLPPAIRYTKATTLNAARRQHALGQGEAPEITRAIGAQVLVIDDLGQEKAADDVWYTILDARYEADRATVVTSGFPLPALHERYGEHLVRRVVEAGDSAGRIVTAFPKTA